MGQMNRGRPRQFDQQQALAAAMEVFWRKGYENASCDDLLTAMKINSGSMYCAFGDKQTLFDKAFDLYCSTVFARTHEYLEGPGSALENVRSLVEFWGEMMLLPDCKGCFLQNTLIEFSQHQDGVAKLARKLMSRLQRMLEMKLVEAAKEGELADDADTSELAAFLVNLASGLNVMSRTGASPKSIRGAVNSAMLLL